MERNDLHVEEDWRALQGKRTLLAPLVGDYRIGSLVNRICWNHAQIAYCENGTDSFSECDENGISING